MDQIVLGSSSMNEIMQKLLTPNLTTVGVIFGISFVTLVYRLGRLVKQQRFTNRFHTKYSQAVENLGNKEFDKASHDWVVRNLPRLKEDMNEHRVSGFSYI